MKKRIAAVLLSSVMCLPVLSSCSNAPDAGAAATTALPDASSQPATQADPLADGLPETDLGGRRFTILCREEIGYEIDVDGESGEVINDAVCKRNSNVEDRFNISIETVKELGNWDSKENFLTKVRSSVQAGDGAYDLIAGYEAYIVTTGYEGLMLDLNSLDYLDFSRPWWNSSFAQQLEIGGRLFHCVSDLSLSLWENIYVIFFNKKMIKDYNIESPYELVGSGKWTIGKLDEICRTVTGDLDGDGKNSKEDLHGYATETGNLVDLFHGAFDVPVTTRNANGDPEMSMNTPKMVSVVEKLYSFLYENPGVWAQPESVSTADNPLIEQFLEEKVMFLPDCLGNARGLRNMDTDFGIIPLPKWDEAQERYQSQSQDGFSVFSIPADAKDPSVSALMLEALSAESRRTIIPAYYDTALKTKFSRDEESEAMMDIARDNLIFSFGYINSNGIEGMPALQLRFMMSDKKKDFVSMYESKGKIFEKSLAELVQKYKDA